MCPELFSIGSFSIPTYGVLVALGFVLGLTVAGKLAARAGIRQEAITNLGVYIVLAAIVGAKLFMIVNHWDYYSADPGRVFSVDFLRTGGVFYGGLLAALGMAVWYARKVGLPWPETGDIFAPALALGHGVGRLGCFAAGCCWGKPTDAPWAVMFTDPLAHEQVGTPLGIHLHPTQLYEAAGTLLIGGFLLWRFLRPHAPGAILGLYLVLYSAFRLFVEFFRDVSERSFPLGGPLSTTQWVAAALVVAGAVMLLRSRAKAAIAPA